MPGLTPQAQAKLSMLEDFALKVQRLYGLVEQYAMDRTGGELQSMAIKRVVTQLKREFMSVGYDEMAQIASAMEMAAHRGTNQQFKTRVMRELVGNIRSQIEIEQRVTRVEGTKQDEEAEET